MIVSITTQAPRMTAELVESEVTNRIESALIDVPGLRSVRSMSSEDKSYVEVSFSTVSAAAALPLVRDALASKMVRLPATAAEPVLRVERARLGM